MRFRRGATGVVLVVVLGLVSSLPSAAGEADVDLSGAVAPTVDGGVVTGVVSEDPAVGIHPTVAALDVTSNELDAVSGALRDSLTTQAAATEALAETEALLEQLAAEAARVTSALEDTERERDEQARRVRRARLSLRAVALDAYVQAGGGSRSGGPLDPQQLNDHLERHALAGSVRQHHLGELAAANDALSEAEAQLEALEVELAAVEADTEATARERDEASAELASAEARIPGQQVDVDDAWRTSLVVGTDIPLVALDAYYRAAAARFLEDPSCGLRWEALAGISRVEGHHGSYGAAELLPDGTSAPRIIGIALDGTRNTRVITDTDGGALDGDATYDRAVGPMQFIPSTWVRWARDGNGDGVADPHSMYDAARSAAVYLCQSGPGLDTDAGLLRSFFSYNRSAAYGQRVLSLTHQYDALGL